ncbi:hypothetical protein C5O25_08900, partial [Paramuribaculum intestinale]
LSIPIQGHGQARRMPVTRNAPFSLVFSAIRKENYQYVFRGKVVKKLYMAKTHQHNHRAQQLGMMQAGVVARQACLRPYSSPYTQANAPLTDKKWQNSKKMANFAAGMP